MKQCRCRSVGQAEKRDRRLRSPCSYVSQQLSEVIFATRGAILVDLTEPYGNPRLCKRKKMSRASSRMMKGKKKLATQEETSSP